MTTAQRLLVSVLLVLLVAGIVALIIKTYGFASGVVLGLLLVLISFVLVISVFRD